MHHFVPIGEFKLELPSGNAQFESKSTIYRAEWPWNLTDELEQGKSEGFDSCDRPSNLTQIGFKSSIFQPVWPWNLMDDPKKTRGHLFYATLSFLHHFIAIGEFKLEWQSGNAQSRSKSTIFLAVWPWNLTDDLQQGKSEGFDSCDRPIVRKGPIWVKIGYVLYRVTLKFDGWPWKTIGHLSFAVSSFVQHFIAIGEFKLELQSGNA